MFPVIYGELKLYTVSHFSIFLVTHEIYRFFILKPFIILMNPVMWKILMSTQSNHAYITTLHNFVEYNFFIRSRCGTARVAVFKYRRSMSKVGMGGPPVLSLLTPSSPTRHGHDNGRYTRLKVRKLWPWPHREFSKKGLPVGLCKMRGKRMLSRYKLNKPNILPKSTARMPKSSSLHYT